MTTIDEDYSKDDKRGYMLKEQTTTPQPPSRPWADAGCEAYVDDGTRRFEYAGGYAALPDCTVIARETLEMSDGTITGSREIAIDNMTLTVDEAYRLAAAIALEAAALSEGREQPTTRQASRVAAHFKTWARGTLGGIVDEPEYMAEMDELKPELMYLQGRLHDRLKDSPEHLNITYGVKYGETEPSAYYEIVRDVERDGVKHEQVLLETRKPVEILRFYGLKED